MKGRRESCCPKGGRKAVEFSLRAISKAEDEVAERERDLTEAKDRLAMEKTLYQDNLLKHKAARSALQLEEQKLEAYRIRQQSQRMAVPEDEKEPEKQQNSGLTTSQEQEVLAAIGRRFGEQAGHIQQILGRTYCGNPGRGPRPTSVPRQRRPAQPGQGCL